MINIKELPEPLREIAIHIQQVINRYCWAEIVGFQESNEILTVELNFEVFLPSRYRTKGVSPTGVKSTEQVFLKFYKWPLSAPRVLLRGDFNRDMPHINPVNDKNYVYPCIYDGGNLSDLLHREDGLFGIFHHMKTWLDRAARDGLYDDNTGWEPIISTSSQGVLVVDLDDETTNKFVKNKVFTYPTVYFLESDSNCYSKVITHENPPLPKDPFPNKDNIGTTFTYVIHGNPVIKSTRREVSSITSLQDIYSWLSELKVKGYLRSEIRTMVQNYTKSHSGKNLTFFILVAIRRPVHLSGTKTTYEYLPFKINYPLTKQGELEAIAEILSHRQVVTPAFAARLSGIDFLETDKSITMLGCGSLGSKLAFHVAKAGAPSFLLIDKYVYQPHNAIRHGLIETDFFPGTTRGKAALLSKELKKLGTSCKINPEDIVEILNSDKEDENLCDSKLIVDSTASAQVRQAIALTSHSFKGRIISTAFHSAGQGSHFFLEGDQRNPRIDDLYALMLDKTSDEKEIRKMLFNNQTDFRPHPVGQGCASVTMIMSDAAASLHAAGTSKLILNYLTEAIPEHGELWLATLDDENIGAKWERTKLNKTKVLKSDLPNMDGWEVRILEPVLEAMNTEIELRSTIETGGPIFGQINSYLKRIIITRTSPPPIDSKFSKHKFIMGKIGLKETTERIEKNTYGNITFLGTWHSHLDEIPASGIDHTTLDKFADVRQGPPFVMLIKTPNNLLGLVKTAF